jgi:hypothetical protein
MPQSPVLQPSFVPFNPNLFRRTSNKRSCDSTIIACSLPFTLNFNKCLDKYGLSNQIRSTPVQRALEQHTSYVSAVFTGRPEIGAKFQFTIQRSDGGRDVLLG